MKNKDSIIFYILFLLLLSLIIMLRQLATEGYFSVITDDAITFTSWARQFTDALREGIIYPRWMHLNFRGYGSPAFILYPPLAFYLTAFINLFVGSVVVSMNVVKFIALFLSSAGMFFLVREFYPPRIAVLPAALYTVFPYNVVVFYLIGTFASSIALIWLSPIILFIYRYMRDRHFRDVLYAGICYGGLIVTHLISAYMFIFVMAAFIMYMSVIKKDAGLLIAIPLIIIVGFLLAAAYIVPLVCEKQFVNLKAFVGEGGGFRSYFILPNLTAKLPSDHFWPSYYGMFVFHFFLFSVLVIISFLLQVAGRIPAAITEDAKAVNIFFLAGSFVSLFLLFGPSEFLWEGIPFFKYIQFPVRWLNLTLFAVVVLSASGFLTAANAMRAGDRYFLVSIVFLVLISLDFVWYIGRASIFPEKDLIGVKGEHYAAEHLPAGVDIGKVARDGDSGEVSVIGGKGEARTVGWKSARRTVDITAVQPVVLRVRTFNFPGWQASIDGVGTQIGTEEGSGAMLIDIPRGRHTLELKFVDTPVRRYSKLATVISSGMVICLLFFLNKRTVHAG